MHKVKFISTKKEEIVILDTVTSRIIKHCIPTNKGYLEIELRKTIYIINSLKFFFNFFKFYIKIKKIKLATLLSLLVTKKTKIIISFSDNNQLINEIGQYAKDVKTILIQNGFRSYGKIHGWSSIKKFPIVYGFGLYEHDLIKDMKIPFQEYNPTGSLKYGIFRRKYAKLNHNKYENKDISFISQYREIIESDYEYKEVVKNIKITIPYLQKNYKNFRIILNEDEDSNILKKETKFYDEINLNNQKNIFLRKSHYLDSYHFCNNSNILITYTSTLGFEFYGVGKKILFLGDMESLSNNYSINFKKYLSFIPDFVKVTMSDVDQIKEKIRYIDNLSQEEYLAKTKNSRKYLMNYGLKFTHEIVAQRISKILNN